MPKVPERYPHLEITFLAVIAGAWNYRLKWHSAVIEWQSLGISFLVFAVVLWLLEQWCRKHLEVIARVFPRFPMAWCLMLVSGIYGFNLGSMLHLPSWIVLTMIFLSIGSVWNLVGTLLRRPSTRGG